MSDGYRIYLERCKNTDKKLVLTKTQYNNVVRMFCKGLAEDIENKGMVDLPCDTGMVAAVRIPRTPRYNKKEKKYSYTSVDWDRTREEKRIVMSDGTETFGIAYVAKHTPKMSCSRCFGIRANKSLFKRMKKRYNEGELGFALSDINNYVI